MASSAKVEYPPLLPLGFHLMTAKELRAMCVDAFPLSIKRDDIMTKLEEIIDTLAKEKVVADMWVNGSFMTRKIDPEDSDILLVVQGDFYDNRATLAQRAVIDWINSNLKTTHLCDSYVSFQYPEGHQWHTVSKWMEAYWIRQFGFSRQDQFKGMAVVRFS